MKEGVFKLPNKLFRDIIKENIEHALKEASNAIGANHPALKGRIREISLSYLFNPLLTTGVCTGTGKIIDSVGNQSKQTDVVIYSKSVLPSAMYSKDMGMFPSETCAYAIEVKTKTSASTIKDAITKARALRDLKYTSGIYDENDKPVKHQVIRVIPALFAFSSDLKDGKKTEIERYKELDKDPPMGIPSIPAICIVGKGYWSWKENNWFCTLATSEHDEVIAFISGVINTIPKVLESRKNPRLGNYLMRPQMPS